MRFLAVDPGVKRIGVAISDPTGTIASPFTVIKHISRQLDAAMIAQIAIQQHAGFIIIGKSMDEDGLPTPASRRADRLAEAIMQQCDIPCQMWDESYSTHDARQGLIAMNIARHKRAGHLDELAATVILQSYLDSEVHE